MKIIDITKDIPSTNFSNRITQKLGIVFHLTDDTYYDQAANWCKSTKARVSYNYIFERNGDIKMLVRDENVAYHGGVVRKPTAQIITDHKGINPNDYLLGFGVVGKPGMKLSSSQKRSLVWFTELALKKNNIPFARYNMIGHNEVNSIGKVYCPVTLYSVDSIIRAIEQKTVNVTLKNDDKELKTENERLKFKCKNLEKQVERFKISRRFWFNECNKLKNRTPKKLT